MLCCYTTNKYSTCINKTHSTLCCSERESESCLEILQTGWHHKYDDVSNSRLSLKSCGKLLGRHKYLLGNLDELIYLWPMRPGSGRTSAWPLWSVWWKLPSSLSPSCSGFLPLIHQRGKVPDLSSESKVRRSHSFAAAWLLLFGGQVSSMAAGVLLTSPNTTRTHWRDWL